MADSVLHQLGALGQSIWLDNLTRAMVRDGSLAALVRDGLTGVTSNPAIFHKAITTGAEYDAEIQERAVAGESAHAIYEALAIADIQGACDVLLTAHEASGGSDGFVSLEVSPRLARDTRGTLDEARRLWAAVNRPNVLIKIPGTPEGVPAIRECLREGINVNVTLLFSLEAHQAVMDAHLEALEHRMDDGKSVTGVVSVASFFLSRIDSLLDPRLDALGTPEAKALRGQAAVASAKLAYAAWQTTFSGDRWTRLQGAGAFTQKPLWASTSTKDPAYPDLKYVDPLIGPQTINTLPDATLDAVLDHGTVATTITEDLDAARATLRNLEALGISMREVTDQLVEEGIDKFIQPFDALLAGLDAKRKELSAQT